MRRSSVISSLLLVLLLSLSAALPAASIAAPKSERTVLEGVIENCWAGPDTKENWHDENPNNVHAMWKGMPERWVALLDGQYFASRSVLKSEQYHYKSNGAEQYHNAYVWLMYPGLDPELATGWYEFNGVADTVDAIPFGTEGFLVSHAAGVGRGTLAGQNAHFNMVFGNWGPSELNLCPELDATNWNGTMTLEINNAP